MTHEVEPTELTVKPFANPQNLPCDSLVCDGRPARWTVQPGNLDFETVQQLIPRSCSVHLARICEIVVATNAVNREDPTYYAARLESTVRRENAGRRKR